jgi:hypothetical protein
VQKIKRGTLRKTGCPVPFVKVEIFDVDREGCWWPYISNKIDYLKGRLVFRIPDLKAVTPPVPFPPEISAKTMVGNKIDLVSLNPQPEPPYPPDWDIRNSVLLPLEVEGQIDEKVATKTFMKLDVAEGKVSRVGEVASLDTAVASGLDNLTLTSKVAPWAFIRRCFYSKALKCTTYTDEDGDFKCCFNWYPIHVRRGRLRFDFKPDIIVKITQNIDGVEKTLYMDPYTSTRWNVNSTNLVLTIDSEDIQCGSGDSQERPEGSQVFFTRIGYDSVDTINQTTGLYNQPSGYTNMAYGGLLRFHAQFGDALSSGSPKLYYRLSFSKDGTNFNFFTRPLVDSRVDKITNFKETYQLGPYTIKDNPALYEVRNFSKYMWYFPDFIGEWATWADEEDTNKYTVRLEVFDANGQKMNSSRIDFRNGTITSPAVLPLMTDKCDLVLTIDNKAPYVNLTGPQTSTECGVIEWIGLTPPDLSLKVEVSQENGRLNNWALYYIKGSTYMSTLDSDSSNSGNILPVSKTVSGNSMLTGVSGTCAFALKLYAYSHIRDGVNSRVYYSEKIIAIVVKKCP